MGDPGRAQTELPEIVTDRVLGSSSDDEDYV